LSTTPYFLPDHDDLSVFLTLIMIASAF